MLLQLRRSTLPHIRSLPVPPVMPSERVVPGDEDHPHPHAFAVVWTTLPGLSIFLPSIGHLGIADSAGVIRDFSGPYTVGVSVRDDICVLFS